MPIRARRARSSSTRRSGLAPSASAVCAARRHCSSASSRRPASASASASRHRVRAISYAYAGPNASRTACQACGSLSPAARWYSASARASQPRPSGPRMNLGRLGNAAPSRAMPQQFPGRGLLGARSPVVAGGPGLYRPVGARGQGDRGRPQDRRRVTPRRDVVDVDRGLGLGQGLLGVALPESVLGEQAVRDERVVEAADRPERLDPGAPLLHRRVAARDVDEQGHRGQGGLGRAGDPDREAVGDLLRVIPLAVREVALEVQVLQVHPVRGHVEAGLDGPLGALVRHGPAGGQIAPLQVSTGQVISGAQLHAEHRGLPGLLVRRGQQLDGLIVTAFAIAHETQGHERVGLHPGRVGGAGGGDPALGPVPGHTEVLLHHQGIGVGGERPRVLRRRRVRGSGLNRGPRDLGGLGGGLGIIDEHQVEGQPLADPAGQLDVDRRTALFGLGGEELSQPPEQVHGAVHVPAVRRAGRGHQAELAAGHTRRLLRVGHSLPQGQRLIVVAVRLGRRAQLLRVLPGPDRRGERAGNVMAGQAVLGQFGGGARDGQPLLVGEQ